jgi:hypothetical protein
VLQGGLEGLLARADSASGPRQRAGVLLAASEARLSSVKRVTVVHAEEVRLLLGLGEMNGFRARVCQCHKISHAPLSLSLLPPGIACSPCMPGPYQSI